MNYYYQVGLTFILFFFRVQTLFDTETFWNDSRLEIIISKQSAIT